jgi:hypothetical protein
MNSPQTFTKPTQNITTRLKHRRLILPVVCNEDILRAFGKKVPRRIFGSKT